MKARIEVDGFLKYLDVFQQKARKSLSQMIVEILRLWGTEAVQNKDGSFTPLGDYSLYKHLYDRRPDNWAKEPGLARGGWYLGFTPSIRVNTMSIDQTGSKFTNKVDSFEARFNLGNDFYIYNSTPYINHIRGHDVGLNAYMSLRDISMNVIETYKIIGSHT